MPRLRSSDLDHGGRRDSSPQAPADGSVLGRISDVEAFQLEGQGEAQNDAAHRRPRDRPTTGATRAWSARWRGMSRRRRFTGSRRSGGVWTRMTACAAGASIRISASSSSATIADSSGAPHSKRYSASPHATHHEPASYWDIIGRATNPREGNPALRRAPWRRKTASGMRHDGSGGAQTDDQNQASETRQALWLPKHERKVRSLTHRPQRGTRHPAGPILDENPGSVRSGNQQLRPSQEGFKIELHGHLALLMGASNLYPNMRIAASGGSMVAEERYPQYRASTSLRC